MKDGIFRALCLLAIILSLMTVVSTAVTAATLTQNESGSTRVTAQIEVSSGQSSEDASSPPEPSESSDDEPDGDDSVNTGDPISPAIWCAPLLLSACVLAVMLTRRRKDEQD